VLIAESGPVTERFRVREIDNDEGRRLVRITRPGSVGSDLAGERLRRIGASGSQDALFGGSGTYRR